MRVGNPDTAGTKGITTVEASDYYNGKFDYFGKKGVPQIKEIKGRTKTLIDDMKNYSTHNNCEQLFCYKDNKKANNSITDDNVRKYMKSKIGIGTLHSFRFLKANEIMFDTIFNQRKSYKSALPIIAETLGHKVTDEDTKEWVLEKEGKTAKTSYIHPKYSDFDIKK